VGDQAAPPAQKAAALPVDPATLRYRHVAPAEAMELLPPILDIEYQVYEPARRTPPAEIKAALAHAESSVIVAEAPGEGGAWTLVGFGIGAPLEESREVEGPDDDAMLGKHNTMYSASITVAPGWQSSGIGRRIKEMQLRDAAARKRADGTPRYRYVTGRNRVGRTANMTHLNRVFGAHVVSVLTGQYEDPEGQAIYYRIPLGGLAPDPALRAPAKPVEGVDLASGLTRVFTTPPASLSAAEESGLLYGPAVNKITLMNYATPGMIRALEWIGALLPDLPHMYLTSSRDEAFDKSLRLVKGTRKGARIAIGLDGGYLGHTVASARSLSDPEVHRGGPGHFAWPRVPHPAVAGTAATIAALRVAIAEAGGPDHVFGFYVELVQERTGRVLPADFGPALAALKKDLDIPVVAVETTTALYRSGHGPFASAALGLDPDILLWWGGGQTGYLHCKARWFIGTPLTLVSTWDGDELSLVRQHHQLRAARRLDIAAASRELDSALEVAAGKGMPWQGLGLYRVIDAGYRADALWQSLRERGALLRRFPNGHLGVVPTLDGAATAAAALRTALDEVL
jgi:RHH-type proline utilization regulon transcriptional repressor/proline dehydrogenase/delta 1-pyrroline-5-carboxylate dehydrogenase